jgi:hypothetical protein
LEQSDPLFIVRDFKIAGRSGGSPSAEGVREIPPKEMTLKIEMFGFQYDERVAKQRGLN